MVRRFMVVGATPQNRNHTSFLTHLRRAGQIRQWYPGREIKPPMLTTKVDAPVDHNPQETSEWLEALEDVLAEEGPERASFLLTQVMERAASRGLTSSLRLNTRYRNTIPADQEVPYPGDQELERRIKSLVRWNAIAMVVRQNKYDPNIGGHISTFASLANTRRGRRESLLPLDPTTANRPATSFISRATHRPECIRGRFLKRRLSEEHLKNFRHELRDHPGLSSYPHPWLMPDFWQFPTVSMGLGPINAIYQARFMRYLENRGIVPATPRKIWAFVGDGETDEPETLGALTLATREKLDNLIFVINCNLQRLDGPVRGNGSIIQELEGSFRGAGWNVIKVIWGRDWDELFKRDTTGLLLKRMEECVDGEYQSMKARGGKALREEFFGKYPELKRLVEDKTDDQLLLLKRGGHDPVKVYNGYKRAVEHRGQPTVILAKTIKGYGMGEAGEGRNITHQQKKLNEDELLYIKNRFNIPITDEAVHAIGFYKPAEDSAELKYMREPPQGDGRAVAFTQCEADWPSTAPKLEHFADALGGSRGREASTTSAFVAVLKSLMKVPELKQVHRADHTR